MNNISDFNNLNQSLERLNNQLNSSHSRGRRWNIRQKIASINEQKEEFFKPIQITSIQLPNINDVTSYNHCTFFARAIPYKEPQGLFGFTRKQTIVGGIALAVIVGIGVYLWWTSGSKTADGGGKPPSPPPTAATAATVATTAAAAAQALSAARKKAAEEFTKQIGSVLTYIYKHDLEWLKSHNKITDAVYEYLKYVRDVKGVNLKDFCEKISVYVVHGKKFQWLVDHAKLYL